MKPVSGSRKLLMPCSALRDSLAVGSAWTTDGVFRLSMWNKNRNAHPEQNPNKILVCWGSPQSIAQGALLRRRSGTCGDVVTVPFRGDRARLAVVVYSDLWRQSDNFTLAPLTGSYKRFKMVHTYIQVPDRAGIGTVDLVAENDRMQWVPRG